LSDHSSLGPTKPEFNISVFLELPHDGTLGQVRIHVRSDDGKDLTKQAILDAVADVLLDADFGIDYTPENDLSFDA